MGRRNTRGLTLVELMVAMLIGTLVLAAVSQVFLTSKSTHRLEEGLARVQENGRFALEFLAQDIRMAGFAGCNSSLLASKINSIAQPATDPTLFGQEGLRAFRYAGVAPANAVTDWNPDLPAEYFPIALDLPNANTDVIIIERASTLSAKLTENMGNLTAQLQILDTAGLAGVVEKDAILMISDCTAADIFRMSNTKSAASGKINIAHGAGDNTVPQFQKIYDGDAELFTLVSRAYFIKNGASGEPALFRRELGLAGALVDQELVEGIETMMFLLGEDTDATADQTANIYRRPANVVDWRKVVSVRVGVLGRTLENVDPTLDTSIYNILNDAEATTEAAFDDFNPADDRRRRKVFSATVRVRNH